MSDCCPADKSGEESFKGIVSFPPTLVSQNVINTCKYNPTSTSSRKCRGDLKDGPKWEEVDFDNCKAKSNVTNNLINLSKTKLCKGDTGGTECQKPVEKSRDLSILIKNGESITTSQDLQYTGIILKELANSIAFLPNSTYGDAKKVIRCYRIISSDCN